MEQINTNIYPCLLACCFKACTCLNVLFGLKLKLWLFWSLFSDGNSFVNLTSSCTMLTRSDEISSDLDSVLSNTGLSNILPLVLLGEILGELLLVLVLVVLTGTANNSVSVVSILTGWVTSWVPKAGSIWSSVNSTSSMFYKQFIDWMLTHFWIVSTKFKPLIFILKLRVPKKTP